MSDEPLQKIAADIAAIKTALGAGAMAFALALGAALPASPTSGANGSAGGVASDRDLDSDHGDPVVRKDPARWDGQSFVGEPFSACTPEYLDNMASFLDWKAERELEKPEKAKYARYSRADAARARGWAKRLRAGWKPKTGPSGLGGAPVSDADYGTGGDDEIPF